METPRWQFRFFTIWGGQALSMVGSELVQFALIWWLTETTGSAVTLATATIVSQVPVIVLGPFAGALVDRWNRKWVLILSDGIIAVLTALLGLLFWLEIAQLWHVYAILFLRSLAGRFQDPAMIATTTAMVPRDQLTRVGGIRSTYSGVMRFAAPPMGALLLGLIGVRGVLPLDLITAAFAIAPLLLISIPGGAPREAAGRSVGSVLVEFRQGLRYVWDRPGLRYLMGTAALWSLAAAPALALMPLFVTEHLGKGALELGWVQSGWGIGMIAGGVLLSAWGGFQRSMATSVTGTSIVVFGFIVITCVPATAWWVAVVGMGLVGLGAVPHSSGLRATQQIVVDPSMQGRYFGLSESLLRAIGPLALAVAAPLVDRYGVRMLWYATVANGLLIACLRRFVPAIYLLEDTAEATPAGAVAVPAGQ